jgi:hypothetical protein
VLPVMGAIGTQVDARAFLAGLDEARKSGAQFIVIYIDSPGGSIGDMREMTDALARLAGNLHTVALVKRAYSAAAVLAMSTRNIFMQPGAEIGAAVPFRMTDNGPKDVEAKFRSIVEAHQCQVVRAAGHNDLLLRGMMEMDLELFVRQADGRVMVSDREPGARIKSKGQILTLTAQQAADCGLARVATDLADVGRQLTGGDWHSVSRRPWNAVLAAEDFAKRETKRQSAIEQVRPAVQSVDRRIAELTERIGKDSDGIAELNAKAATEAAGIEAEYQATLASAGTQGDAKSAAQTAGAQRDAELAELNSRLKDNVDKLANDGLGAQDEITHLHSQRDQIVAGIPPD